MQAVAKAIHSATIALGKVLGRIAKFIGMK